MNSQAEQAKAQVLSVYPKANVRKHEVVDLYACFADDERYLPLRISTDWVDTPELAWLSAANLLTSKTQTNDSK
jgi:hypothetical protein